MFRPENFNWMEYDTDKSDFRIRDNGSQKFLELGHGYSRNYNKHFFNIRHDIKKVLEIGTRPGSIKLWLDYFPNAKIFGIDLIEPDFSDERFTFEKVDQSNRQELESFFKKHGSDFDIVIDDGLHAAYEQQVTLDVCFKHIKSGGCHVIEDLHCQRDEEKNGPHYRATKFTNMDIYELIKDFALQRYNTCSVITNHSIFANALSSMHIENARNCRWLTMSTPSEIVFLKKK